MDKAKQADPELDISLAGVSARQLQLEAPSLILGGTVHRLWLHSNAMFVGTE